MMFRSPTLNLYESSAHGIIKFPYESSSEYDRQRLELNYLLNSFSILDGANGKQIKFVHISDLIGV